VPETVVDRVKIGRCEVSRFILGSNPFSGFSHQSAERDQEMVHYWSCARIKEALCQAEALGINTVIARADHHMLRVLTEHWDEGGRLQWFGQTCPELGAPEPTLRRVAGVNAPACHIHGGYADHLLAKGALAKLIPTVQYARSLGLVVGLAAHETATLRWAEEHLDVDYYMCSYYNPIPRKDSAEHQHGYDEAYLEEDRRAMADLIQELTKPVIHYKILAAGRNDPAGAFEVAARAMRPGDAVCVGVYTKDHPGMLADDVTMFERALACRAAGAGRRRVT
jgi:hypothetical protein